MLNISSRKKIAERVGESLEKSPKQVENIKENDIDKKILEIKALTSRLLELPLDIRQTIKTKDILIKWNWNVVDKNLMSLIDEDLALELRYEYFPDYIEKDEYNEIVNRLQALLSIEDVRKKYSELSSSLKTDYIKLIKLIKTYEKWVLITDEKEELTVNWKLKKQKKVMNLDEANKNAVARQVIRLLNIFKDVIEQEIQNIHNNVSSDWRDYKKTDEKAIYRLGKQLEECNNTINRLIATNHEVAIQMRLDEIKQDSAIISRSKNIKKNRVYKNIWDAFVEVESRKKVIYWDDSWDNYILAALRNWQNVELLWPTWTGKTKLAIHAATVFAWKPPIIISGWPWVYRSTFYWSAKDLWKRNLGTVIQCIVEDRILIIDEDNRIDPRQMAEIKYILWLKPGDKFTHPDTWEEFIIPRHFALMVTRNEKDKHHWDRFDLPPEYRREFTHWSFEIDYYTPDEMYDHFLLPKLLNDDWSISLSKEEIGWDIKKNQSSPLLALTLAAKDIQEQYKQTKLKNAVFESGYLIDVLNQWKEVRFKKMKDWNSITFLQFLETKLLEFVKRPIWNQDRKIIIQILINHWFYKWYSRDKFVTVKDWEVFTEAEFKWLEPTLKIQLFKNPINKTLSPREVALLDPFFKREIKIPPHPLENEINEFVSWYQDFCENNTLKPIVITPHNFDTQKKNIIESIKKKIDDSNINNWQITKSIIDQIPQNDTIKFIEQLKKIVDKLDFGNPLKWKERNIWQQSIPNNTTPWTKWKIDIQENNSLAEEIEDLRSLNEDIMKIQEIANFATSYSNNTIANEIINNWYNWLIKNRDHLLIVACINGITNIVDALLNFWANPFILRLSSNSTELNQKIRRLLTNRADLIKKTMHEIWWGNEEHITKYTQNIDSKDGDGNTLIIQNAKKFSIFKKEIWIDQIEELLKLWVSMSEKNNSNETIFDIAKQINNPRLTKILDKEKERREKIRCLI